MTSSKESKALPPFSLSLSFSIILFLPSRSSWHPFYAHTSPREMANMEDAEILLGPTGETDGTIANDRSRFIEYVSTYCLVALLRGGRIIETCVGAVGGTLRGTVAGRRRVWRKFAASKGIKGEGRQTVWPPVRTNRMFFFH